MSDRKFIIFDLDGTLAINEHRQHYMEASPKNWDAFFAACDKDDPDPMVIQTLRVFWDNGHRIEIWSGRSETVRAKTLRWLNLHGIPPLPLRMRGAHDFRPDTHLKESWLMSLEQKDWPDLVLDDRDSVVEMWRRNGIKCFQVERGDF